MLESSKQKCFVRRVTLLSLDVRGINPFLFSLSVCYCLLIYSHLPFHKSVTLCLGGSSCIPQPGLKFSIKTATALLSSLLTAQ